jgi:hypothetical protein
VHELKLPQRPKNSSANIEAKTICAHLESSSETIAELGREATSEISQTRQCLVETNKETRPEKTLDIPRNPLRHGHF